MTQALGQDLERVEQVCYLGQIPREQRLAGTIQECAKSKAEMGHNLTPFDQDRSGTTGCWHVLQSHRPSRPPVCCAETWAVAPKMLQVLDSFHHQIARHIAKLMPWLQ